MAYLEALIIEEGFVNGQDQSSLASVQAFIEASQLWQTYFPAGLDISVSVTNPTWYLTQDWYQELNVSSYPVILIAAGANNQLLARISSSRITPANILQTILAVTQLRYDQGTGKYVYPDGSPIGNNGLLATDVNSGGGGGLISAGIPGFIDGSWLALGLAAFGAYKAAKTKDDSKYLWGAAAGYGLLSYTNQVI